MKTYKLITENLDLIDKIQSILANINTNINTNIEIKENAAIFQIYKGIFASIGISCLSNGKDSVRLIVSSDESLSEVYTKEYLSEILWLHGFPLEVINKLN